MILKIVTFATQNLFILQNKTCKFGVFCPFEHYLENLEVGAQKDLNDEIFYLRDHCDFKTKTDKVLNCILVGYPLSSQAPTHVEVEFGCDNFKTSAKELESIDKCTTEKGKVSSCNIILFVDQDLQAKLIQFKIQFLIV